MLRIQPYDELHPRERRRVLEMLFEESPDREERIELFVHLLDSRAIASTGVLTCWDQDRLLGVLVCELLAGNCAGVWPIRLACDLDPSPVADELLTATLRLLATKRVRLVQSLIPSGQPWTREAFQRHGFQAISHVWSMRLDLPISLPKPTERLTMEPVTIADPAFFHHVLVTSFVDSLDCPELNGIRTIEEIIAGYRVSAPDLSRWHLFWDANRPIGIAIIAVGASPGIDELAYLGVVPEARGRGFGRDILTTIIHQSQEHQARAITLLVDERNQPAIKLYSSFEFQRVETREVLLRLTPNRPRAEGELPDSMSSSK